MSHVTHKKTRRNTFREGVESLRPGSIYPPPCVGPVVYFIREVRDGGAVKIGIARSLSDRLGSLQVGNSTPLEVLAWTAGSELVENCLHQALMRHYLRGEWFSAHEDVLTAAQQVHGLTRIDWRVLVPVLRRAGLDVRNLTTYLESAGEPHWPESGPTTALVSPLVKIGGRS